MTQSLHVQRCELMSKTLKLCAEALSSNAQGDFVTGVAGVTMTLLKGNAELESAPTNDAGVVQFAEKVTPGTMSQYTIRADLGADVPYQFHGQPDQDAERGNLFRKTGHAYVHKVVFRFEPRAWIAVRVVDAAGAVLTGLRVKFTRPDGTATEATVTQAGLRDDGSHRLSEVPPGQYKISLLGLDQDLWASTAAPDPVAPVHFAERPPLLVGREHAIEAGDCVVSLGVRYGVTADSIWDFDANADLRRRYANRDTLRTGETLRIPRVRLKEELCDSGVVHHFVVGDMPRRMKVRFRDRGDVAAAGIAGTVEIAGAPTENVTTDGEGAIEFPVPPDAAEAKITMPGLGLDAYTLKLGHLEPIEAPEGVLQRLKNLGYYRAPSPPGADADRAALEAAVHSFQRSRALAAEAPAANGTVGRATMDALVEAGGA